MAETDDLQPPIRAGQLSPGEHEARRRATREYAAIEAEATARIDRALRTARPALEALRALHTEIGERFRFEIGANTRWSATWELGAAALGYANAMVYLLEGGFHVQIAPLYRSVHEALGLLSAVWQPEEEPTLRKFVENKKVSSGDGHAALKRDVQRMRDAKAAEGISSETIQINEQAGRLYGHLSEASHIRRQALAEFVDAPTRQAFVGSHNDPRVTTHYAEVGLLLLEQTAMLVGWTLGGIAGENFYRERVNPILKDIRGITHDPEFIEGLPEE